MEEPSPSGVMASWVMEAVVSEATSSVAAEQVCFWTSWLRPPQRPYVQQPVAPSVWPAEEAFSSVDQAPAEWPWGLIEKSARR